MLTAGFFLRLAAVLGAAGVALGAFGAHGLKQRLAPDLFEIFEVGVRYHFYHALALLAVAAAGGALWESRWTGPACLAWSAGIVVFSGSLYLLALTGTRWLGAVTPIGGVLFIAGWVLLLLAAWDHA